jgi:hypothetical protein
MTLIAGFQTIYMINRLQCSWVFWYKVINILEEAAASIFRAEYSSTLKLGVICSSGLLVTIYQTTQCHISEDHNLSIHCHENLNSKIFT